MDSNAREFLFYCLDITQLDKFRSLDIAGKDFLRAVTLGYKM